MAQKTAQNGERQIDWDHGIQFFKRTLNRLVDRPDEYLVQSLASDAALRLVRVARREYIKNVDAMMTTIAYRVYQDWKRKIVGEPVTVSLDVARGERPGIDIPAPDPAYASVDAELASREWITFKALEFIHQVAGGECRDYLKAYYLERRDHAEISESIGINILAARKRKSRCEATLSRWTALHSDHPMAAELHTFFERFEE